MADFLDDYDEELQENYFPKKKREVIDIPNFLQSTGELPTEEQLMAQAMLNNTPNNVDIEKQNHLAELERACQNWDVEEWAKVIIHADSHLMFAELDRRAAEYEKSVADVRSSLTRLENQKL